MDEESSDHRRPPSLQDGVGPIEVAVRKAQAGIIAFDPGPTQDAVLGKVAELQVELVA